MKVHELQDATCDQYPLNVVPERLHPGYRPHQRKRADGSGFIKGAFGKPVEEVKPPPRLERIDSGPGHYVYLLDPLTNTVEKRRMGGDSHLGAVRE